MPAFDSNLIKRKSNWKFENHQSLLDFLSFIKIHKEWENSSDNDENENKKKTALMNEIKNRQ